MSKLTGGENWICVERVSFHVHTSVDGELWCAVPEANFDEAQSSVAQHALNQMRKETPRFFYRIVKVAETTRFERVAYYAPEEIPHA